MGYGFGLVVLRSPKCCGFNGDPFFFHKGSGEQKQLLDSLVGFDGKKVKPKQPEQLSSRTDENS